MPIGALLPQEILDRIIDKLPGGEYTCPRTLANRRTLGNCALASRTLVFASRRALFRKIRFIRGTECYRFQCLLQDSPHLGSIVRKLNIIEHRGAAYDTQPIFYPKYKLISALTRLPRLTKLGITLDGWHIPFERLEADLKSAFLGLFKSQALSTILLSGFTTVPLSYLLECLQLKKLEIHHSDLIKAPVLCRPISLPPPIASCQLQSLVVSCGSCAQSLSRVFPIHVLEQLEILEMPFQDGLALLSTAQKSLAHVTIGRLINTPETITLDLRNLTYLSLDVAFMKEDASDLVSMAVILESGGSTPRRLQNVKLDILFAGFDNRAEASLLFDNALWPRLEAVTQQDRYTGLQEVGIIMRTIEDIGHNDDDDNSAPDTSDGTPDFTPFWNKVPSLWKSGKLHVVWRGNIIQTPKELGSS